MADDTAPNPDEMHASALDLPLGPPFAIAHDCELMPRQDRKGIPGCCACVSCDACGQSFRIDLLSDQYSQCPKCKLEYTHCLLVCVRDDEQMLLAAARVIAVSNGLGTIDNPDDDDEADGAELGAEDEEMSAAADQADDDMDREGGR